jgi:cytoskeletal protein CcmA (bactofilin family)
MPFWSDKQEPSPATSEPKPSSASPRQPATTHKEPSSMATIKRDELPTSLGGTSDLLLGAGAEFEGKLTFKGTVRIDAKFTGSIVTNDVLVVGEHAKIDAEISCGTVIVYGEVNGNIKAKVAVELHRPAKVHGDIDTPSLTVEQGVVLHGAVMMDGLDRASTKPTSAPSVAAVN